MLARFTRVYKKLLVFIKGFNYTLLQMATGGYN